MEGRRWGSLSRRESGTGWGWVRGRTSGQAVAQSWGEYLCGDHWMTGTSHVVTDAHGRETRESAAEPEPSSAYRSTSASQTSDSTSTPAAQSKRRRIRQFLKHPKRACSRGSHSTEEASTGGGRSMGAGSSWSTASMAALVGGLVLAPAALEHALRGSESTEGIMASRASRGVCDGACYLATMSSLRGTSGTQFAVPYSRPAGHFPRGSSISSIPESR